MGLVYKIVKGNYDAIPEIYSEDMKNLVDSILNKDTTARPTVQEILLSPFLKSKMLEFVENGGNIGITDLKVKIISKPIEVEQTEEEKEEELLKGLNPREKMLRRKELRSQKEAEKLKQAAIKSKDNYDAAKQRKYDQFYSSQDNKTLTKQIMEPTESHGYEKPLSKFDQFKIDPDSGTFGVNDRYEDTYALSDSYGTEMSKLTGTGKSQKSTGSKFSSHHYDEREIKSSGYYDFDEEKKKVDDTNAEYPDDFEEATRNQAELEDVLDNYRRIYSGDITLPGENPLKRTSSDGLSSISEVSGEDIDPATMSKMRIGKEKTIIMDYFGDELYEEIYDYLKKARTKNADDKVIERQMKKFVGGSNKEALSM